MENLYLESLKKICQEEEAKKLYDIIISDTPIWRIIYRQYRDQYIYENTGVAPLNSHPKFAIKQLLWSSIKSLFQIFKILLKKPHYKNIIFGFPRMERFDGLYLDKFCDPLIEYSSLRESYLYFERGRSGYHYNPRYLQFGIWTEGVDNLSIIIGYLVFPIIYLSNRKKYNVLFKKMSEIFSITRKDKYNILKKISFYFIQREIYKTLIKTVKARNVFSVTLMGRPSLLSACLQTGVKCYELQHGITENETVMYSGKYLPNFSPDAFLAFGQTSVNSFFNVPKSKIINIGLAYKALLIRHNHNQQPKGYLFISDPEVTEEIVKSALLVKTRYPELKIAIRFHPLEKPNKMQMDLLKDKQIEIDDNTINSNIALLKYEGIVGEQSTVLYESVSLGKKTGKLHFNSLNKGLREDSEREKGFFIINNLEDFKVFADSHTLLPHPEYYSDFKLNEFEKIIK